MPSSGCGSKPAFRSAPGKPRPAPVISTARTDGSAASVVTTCFSSRPNSRPGVQGVGPVEREPPGASSTSQITVLVAHVRRQRIRQLATPGRSPARRCGRSRAAAPRAAARPSARRGPEARPRVAGGRQHGRLVRPGGSTATRWRPAAMPTGSGSRTGGERGDERVAAAAVDPRVRRRWRSSSPRSRKSASASCSTTGVPRSSRSFAAIDPRRALGRHHPAEPQARGERLRHRPGVGDPLGARPCSAPTGGAVVAVLGVVVVLEHERVRPRPPTRRAGPARGGQDDAERELVGGGDHHRVERASASSSSTRSPSSSTGTRHSLEPGRGELRAAGPLEGPRPRSAPAARHERAAEQRHALRHAGGHDHALGVAGGAADPAEVRRERTRSSARRAGRRSRAARRGVAERAPQRGEPGVAREERDVRAARPEVEARRALGRRRRPGLRAPGEAASATRVAPPWRRRRGSPRRRAGSRPRRPRRATRRARARGPCSTAAGSPA